MDIQEKWTLKIELQDKVDAGEFFYILEDGRKAISLSEAQGFFVCEIRTDAVSEPLVLKAENKKAVKELKLVYRGYRVELWADGTLEDEEWPMGICLAGNEERQYRENAVKAAELEWNVEKETEECRKISDILYWAPELGKHNVGDCMPFADGDTYHLFYLKDRHQHRSKWGKGAHQFAHIATKDLKNWTEYPAAVEITHQWEGSICTGSIIYAKEKYYAFYAVRMMDGSSAKVSWATSDDCIHFEKSEKYFTLEPPYETSSVRDPEVFAGADGKYHMLLTTNWEACDNKGREGCLAHMVSDDLENWEQKEPFLIPGYTDQPECTDYFEWNGWYYLIFSNYGTAKYRYSRQPFGPWICPENEMIDGLLFRVPKTAQFHGRRIAAGFLCINTMGESYAGSLVLRELVQHEDGTLGTKFAEEVLPEKQEAEKLKDGITIQSTESCGYRKEEFAALGERFEVKMIPEENCREYGLNMRLSEDAAYEIRVQPGWGRISVVPLNSNLYYYPTKRFLEQIKGLEKECRLEVILKHGILDLCINGGRTLVSRMEPEWDTDERIEWEGFVKDGKVSFQTV